MGLRLDIGCGDQPLDGYVAVDARSGGQAYPLAYPDGAADEIRASHILEHFSHTQIGAVLADWVRVLAPGGRLRVAVPDFETVARAYLDGAQIPVQGYVMGGHVDGLDHHGAIFDGEALTEALLGAGLIAIRPWQSEQRDCAALPISLNLEGTKPPETWPSVRAVLSVPRLGWNDMWGCAMEHLGRLGIRVTKHTGAFWEQCLTRAIDEALASEPEYILALDYDTVFDYRDVQTLLLTAMRHPEIDALAALQVHRTESTPLMTVGTPGESNARTLPREALADDLTICRTAHFGLTLIRAETLRTLPRPWFHGHPDRDGEWGEGRTDPDISFWRSWEADGHTLAVANRVPVGHLEVMVRWPDRNMAATWQHPTDYHRDGKPAEVWR